MRADEKRSIRINILYKKALTGKYTYQQLLESVTNQGISKKTAIDYLDTILKKIEQRT